MQKVRVGAGFGLNLDTGRGDDRAALDVREAVCPSDPSLPRGTCQPIDIDITTGGGMDQVEATVQDIGLDLHLDADLGAHDDSFIANILPDNAARGPGDIVPCIDIFVEGRGGNDTFTTHVGDPHVDPNDPNDPVPHLSPELMVTFDGDAGNDSFFDVFSRVELRGPVRLHHEGGAGHDSFFDVFQKVRAHGPLKMDQNGGAGNDRVNARFVQSDLIGELGFDLGAGNDLANIAIDPLNPNQPPTDTRTAAAIAELVPAVRIRIAAGAGHDDATLAIDRAIEDFSALLDGGDGRDIARVTENVKAKGQIVKFERVDVIP